MTLALSLAQEKMEALREGGRSHRKSGEDWQGAVHRMWWIKQESQNPHRLQLIVQASWEDRFGNSKELTLESALFDPLP